MVRVLLLHLHHRLTWCFSCKPQQANGILAAPLMSAALEGKLLISILAGVTIEQLRSWVPASTRVVRAMPNTPCKVSIMVICFVRC